MKQTFDVPTARSVAGAVVEKEPSSEKARIRSILEREAETDAARASGPGGQNVNKVSSKAVVVWYPGKSQGFTDDEKLLLAEKLKSEITVGGYIRRTCSDGRDFHQNLSTAFERFAEAIWKALQIPKARLVTEVPEASDQGRVTDKRMQGKKKEARGAKWTSATE